MNFLTSLKIPLDHTNCYDNADAFHLHCINHSIHSLKIIIKAKGEKYHCFNHCFVIVFDPVSKLPFLVDAWSAYHKIMFREFTADKLRLLNQGVRELQQGHLNASLFAQCFGGDSNSDPNWNNSRRKLIEQGEWVDTNWPPFKDQTGISELYLEIADGSKSYVCNSATDFTFQLQEWFNLIHNKDKAKWIGNKNKRRKIN